MIYFFFVNLGTSCIIQIGKQYINIIILISTENLVLKIIYVKHYAKLQLLSALLS